MHLKYFCLSNLPKLSWAADVSLSHDIVKVYHGDWVEVRKHFFIDGMWNGLFEQGGFDRTECTFGSGAVLKDNSIVFVSSACTTDGLFYCRRLSHCFVSNSLPFILAMIDDRLDPHYEHYDFHNESILDGINSYEKHIHTMHGDIGHLFFRNLEVDSRGFREIDKPMPPHFESYENYYNYLIRNYQLIVENSRAESRQIKLDICSTQSKGYDTTAVNAIASLFGIGKVFTCTKAKGKGAFANRDKNLQRNDDGTEICQALGLKCIPIDRRAFEEGFEDEYLYHAAQHANQDANFIEISHHLENPTILLTGVLGEIWYGKSWYEGKMRYLDSDLRKFDLGCHGLTEIRLQAGFIQLPLPYLGAQRRSDIQKISDSPEMEQWKLGNVYDRPIPRRIAEERGIHRSLFGQTKLASVVEFPLPCVPNNSQLRKEYFSFLNENKKVNKFKICFFPFIHVINSALTFKFERRYKFIYYMERIISKLIGKDFVFPLLWRHLNGSIFCFAVNKRIIDYEKFIVKGAQLEQLSDPRQKP